MARDNLIIEGAKIIFRNFSGEATQYNRAGNRNFCVIIEDEDLAAKLIEDGWNLKLMKPRDPDEQPNHYLQVTVSYANVPPQIYQVTSSNKVLLSEETISGLDYADIDCADLVINPYHWDVNGKTGIKAYLGTGYFTIREDAFAKKYEGVGIGSDVDINLI